MSAKVKRRPKPKATFDDLMTLDRDIRKLTFVMRRSLVGLRGWDHEDLVQEAYLRAMLNLDKFEGRGFRTWVSHLVRNHLISLARAAAVRPKPGSGCLVDGRPYPKDQDASHRMELRDGTKGLLQWLKSEEHEIQYGWEVLNLLLYNHGNVDYVSVAMTVHTGYAWTSERVRNVVRAIRETPKGQALCESIGIITKKKER